MKEQAFTTPQLANDHFDIVIQETRALGCKNSRAKASEQWFAESKNTQICSTVTTQNGYSLSEFEISQESIMQDKVEEDMGTTQDFCEEEFKVAVELQRKKLVEDFQIEMNKKMDEVEQKICKRWEDAIVKMHVDYEQKVEKHNEMLKEIKEKKQEEMESQQVQLEKEINEKYQKDYMEKLDALTENLQKVEQDRYIEIINEVKAELETEFSQRNEAKLAALQAEIQEEIANEKEKDEESMIKAELIENLEKDMKEAYDLELTDLVVRQQRDIAVLKDCVRDLEEGVNYEDMKTEVKERMAQEYHIKEDMMNRDWKEKMELFKKETEEGIAQQRTKRLSQEFLEIAIEKKGLAVNDSGLKLKRMEEANKELEKRLAEQEEMYAQTVEDLKKELEVLKPVSARNNFGERLSVRNTSAEREARKTAGGQRNSVGSTDKLRRSCGEAGLAELLMINMKTSEDSVKKAGDTWRPRRSLCSTESRKNSMEPQKGKEKSPEVRKNLSKTLMKVTLPPKQNAFPSKPFNFERATKAILQMLSPSSPSELRNGQLDMRQDTRVDTVGSKEDNECDVKEVKKTVNVPKLALHTTRNSGVSGERSERGRGSGSVEREPKQSEGALRKKDVNTGARRGSVTDRKMDNKEVDKVMRSSDKAFTAKYEELLKRQGGLARRREGSVTQRKENVLVSQMKENMSKGGSIMEWRNGGKKCEYAKLFEIKNDDEQEVKNMKRLKKTVEENMKENEVLASKCNAKEVDLCVSFPLKISIQSCEQSRTLQNKLQTLFKLWKTAEVSYIARIAFIEGLEKLLRYDEIIAKIDLELNEMTKLVNQTEEIIKLLQWRTQLRDQINTDDFSYNQYEKVYMALVDNNRDLKRSLECYQNKHGKRIQYRGVDLGEIVELDAWECEFLQKISCQRNSVQRLK